VAEKEACLWNGRGAEEEVGHLPRNLRTNEKKGHHPGKRGVIGRLKKKMKGPIDSQSAIVSVGEKRLARREKAEGENQGEKKHSTPQPKR